MRIGHSHHFFVLRKKSQNSLRNPGCDLRESFSKSPSVSQFCAGLSESLSVSFTTRLFLTKYRAGSRGQRKWDSGIKGVMWG